MTEKKANGQHTKVGVLGGTFDPVHMGHLAIAEEARARVGMDQVIFLPAGQPWMKKDIPVSPTEHRLNMLKLAISGKPYLKVSTAELEHEGSSYAVETIAGIRQELGAGAELFFIMGWDSLAVLPLWREPERLIGMCRIVVVPRPGYPAPDVKALDAVIPGLSRRVLMLDKLEVDISATEIRERVRRGLPISHLVPEAVEWYIREHGLYLGD
ncbi:MAG: nicotinate-nucleotide adenylyltransferase [Dehalococcoidia bacterium]|nr:nicotinate-nucleotide adenylyltransferase [Dehalococcoidia bacterium]